MSDLKCPNCGELGPHWIEGPASLEEAFGIGKRFSNFWTCPIYYGENGRRISPKEERALDERLALSKVSTP